MRIRARSLFKGYSTIPWALGGFQLGKICRTTASSTIGVDRDPIGIAQRAEIVGFLSAGKNSENRLQVIAVDVEEQTNLARRGDCALQHQNEIFRFFALPSRPRQPCGS